MTGEHDREPLCALFNRASRLLLELEAHRLLLEFGNDHGSSEEHVLSLAVRATRDALRILQLVHGWPDMNAKVHAMWSVPRSISAQPTPLGHHRLGYDLAVSTSSADQAPQVLVDVRLSLQAAERLSRTPEAMSVLQAHVQRLTPLHLGVSVNVESHVWESGPIEGRILGISTRLTSSSTTADVRRD